MGYEMTSEAQIQTLTRQPPVATPRDVPCSTARMRPRLGTLAGTSQAAQARFYPAPTPTACASTPASRTGVHLENVTNRRRDRILDWPQFRLRRKITSTPVTNGLKRSKTDPATETGTQRLPVKAVHPPMAAVSYSGSIDTKPVVIGTPPDNRLRPSIKNPGLNQVFSGEVQPAPHCRRGISTNPHVRRRYSADGLPIHADDMLTPSPAKRMFQLPGQTAIPHASSMNLLSHDRIISNLNDSDATSDDGRVTLIRIPTWHRLLDRETSLKPKSGRHSVGSVQPHPAAKSETHISSSSCSKGRRQRRSSHLFTELRRSARQTLDTLCKALRNSTTNLVDSTSKVDPPPIAQTEAARRLRDDVTLTPNQPISPPKLPIRPIEANPVQRVPSHVHLPEQQLTKFVELRRSSLLEPFGLFVTKSEFGFRVTRLSEYVPLNACPDTANLQVGDELIQVNGLQCSRLSLIELSQHFSERLTLLLTVRCKT